MDASTIAMENPKELLIAQAHIWNHIFAYHNSAALKCAMELGIPDAIQKHGKPMTLQNLAISLGITPIKTPSLYRLLRLLVHYNFFSMTKLVDGEEAYANNINSQLLLKDHPCTLTPFTLAMLDPGLTEPSHYLSKWFRNQDESAFYVVHGRSFWEHAGLTPEFNQLFNQAMSSDAGIVSTTLVASKDFRKMVEGLGSLVDVAGGNGSMTKAIARAYPWLKCIVFDLPHVVDGLQGNNESNLEYVAGDMFKKIPSVDAVLLKRLPSECTAMGSIHDDELAGPYGDDTWPDRGNELVGLASSRGGRGRGRGRTRGGRSQRRVVGTGRRNVTSNERPGSVLTGWKSRSDRGKGGRKRGRRSARSQQKPIKKPPAVSGARSLPDPIPYDKSPPGFSGRNDWNTEETRMVQAEEVYVNDDSMSERSDYNDDNAQASGDDYDDMPVDAYTSVYNGNPSHLVDENDYNVDEEENDDDMDEDDLEGAEYEQDDTNIGRGFTIPDSDDEENGDELGVRDQEQDDTSDNASTDDYSSSSE